MYRTVLILLAALPLMAQPATIGQGESLPVLDLPQQPARELPAEETVRTGRELEGTLKQERARAELSASAGEFGEYRWGRTDPFSDYDVVYYELNLAVFQGSESLNGAVRMDLASLVDGLESITLHAGSNLMVDQVLQDQTELEFTRSGDELTATLAVPLDEGAETSLWIGYSADYTGQGIISLWRTNQQTGEEIHVITSMAEPFDARHWWPCKDDTRDKADSVLVSVTTDDFNSVVSNGLVREDLDHGDGTRTTTWFEGWPIVTYLVSICVTEYNHTETTWEWEDVILPLHDWSWSLTFEEQNIVMELGQYSLTALSDLYGMYPFADEKYGHAQYLWGGAMEHQTCSSMGFYTESVIAHELAHQWFGDKLTCDTFHHIWLNEGWATYSEALYYEYYLGEWALHEYMLYEEYWGDGTIWIEDPYSDNIFHGGLSYAKGSWVLHMLRHVVGDDNFWAATLAYLGPNDPEYYRTVTTDEFREFMEAESGMDLGYFFEEWIMGEYWPDYGYYWSQEETARDWELHVDVLQQQAPGHQVFTMPVDLLVVDVQGDSTWHELWNDGPALSYTLAMPAEAQEVLLDPMHWILSQVTLLEDLPAADMAVEELHLETLAGEPLEVIPPSSMFRLRFVARNMGDTAEGLTAELDTQHPGITVLDGPLALGDLDFGQDVEFIFECESGTELTGLAEFLLEFQWVGGDEHQSFELPAGVPELLLVDDDGGDDYQTWYEDALQDEVYYMTLEPGALPADLTPYTLVLWIQGDNERALSEADLTLLENLDEAGGHVVFTGQHFPGGQVAENLEFLNDFCGLEVTATEHEEMAVQGDDNGLFEGETFYLFNGGAGNQEAMDVLNPVLDCVTSLAHYNTLGDEGCAALLRECDTGGGVITCGFGLEGIAEIGTGISIEETLAILLDWARGLTAVDPFDTGLRAESLVITGARPNPFNPSTRIEFTCPRSGLLQLEVFNIAGQLVHASPPRPVSAGRSQLNWTAGREASGMYFAVLTLRETGGRGKRWSDSTKLVLVR